jgi:ABC-type sugar transport system ATPase subunit
MSSVAIHDLMKRFGSTVVLADTSLTVEQGEFVVVMGSSGCGKSTLLRLIAGLETPTSGRILIGGRDVTALDPAERGIAMVFQSYALYPHLSVAENIAFPLRMAKVDREVITAKVAKIADLLDLGTLLERRPRALSGGQRQRVAIGRAIVRDPEVLLLDEPLSNLDAALRIKLRHEFARLHQRLGATMIYVTHDQIEAMTLANRIVVMAAGRVEQVGAPLDLYRSPATIKVAESIGSPTMNLLPVRFLRGERDGAVVELPGGGEWRVAAHAAGLTVGAPLTLGVRPEHLRADPQGPFGGRVELFERLGPLSFAHLGDAAGGRTLVAQLPSDRHVVLGEAVFFTASASDLHLFDAEGAALPRLSP